MNEIKISIIEAKAIERRCDRRDATHILAVLNRVCKENKLGRHYEIRNTQTQGYKVKCGHNRALAYQTGLQSVTHTCFTEERLCGHLISELKKYADIGD